MIMPSMIRRVAWLAIFFTVLLWSGIHPKERVVWWLEVAPALIGLVILAATWRSFRLTPLVYTLILVHSVILMIGGHYTYAEVPLFESLKEVFGFTRNHYDRVGHFAQGFVPALITREIVRRKNLIPNRTWQNFFIVCACLAVSAFYELIEWWVALISGEDASAFLGTQGDPWDTQSDMAMALLGAMLGLAMLNRMHDRQLASMKCPPTSDR